MRLPSDRRRRIAGFATLGLVAVGLTGCLDPTTGRPPSSATAVAAFTSTISTVTAADLGASWHAGCPVGPADLRLVTVAHWGYDGKRSTGRLVVHRNQTQAIVTVFKRLYANRFQIARMTPVAAYGGDDTRSMNANNTSAFNCRKVTGGTGWSDHSYGTSLDLNPIQNPYVKGSTVLPDAGRPWADRHVQVPGMVHRNDPTTVAFAAVGWSWGGNWSSPQDFQHFSANNR